MGLKENLGKFYSAIHLIGTTRVCLFGLRDPPGKHTIHVFKRSRKHCIRVHSVSVTVRAFAGSVAWE